MAVDGQEGLGEKLVEFISQTPEDRQYEDAGGDSDVPAESRTEDPKADANEHAEREGNTLPYPGYERASVTSAEDEGPGVA